MADKKVYIVRGSEDGNLGVYTNYKKAYERAINYISKEDADNYEYNTLKSYTYANTLKEIKRYNHVSWDAFIYGSPSSVEIEIFILNN